MLAALIAIAAVPTSTAAAGPEGGPAALREDWERYGQTPETTPESVDTVVVTGARRAERLEDAVVAPEVVTRREIELSGAENVAELLQEHPGVQIDPSFAGAGIRLQGLDPEHTLILLDGMRLNGRVEGTIDLNRFPAERIERVEIIKGPASALYGSDALGGVVNIITRKPEKGIAADAHAAFGTLEGNDGLLDVGGPNTLDLSGRVSFGAERARGSVSAGLHHQGAFDLTPEDPATTGAQLDTWNVEGHGIFDLSPRARFDLRLDVARRELAAVEQGADLGESPDNPFRPDPVRAEFDRINRTTTLSASAGPTVDLAEGHTLRVLGFYTRFEDTFIRDQRGDDSSDLEQVTTDDVGQMTAQYDGKLSDAHQLTVGLEGLYERIGSERLRSGQGDRGRFSVFGQHEWAIVERLSVVPGFRLDVDSQFGAFPAPKIALRWDPIDALALRASYGLGFRAPLVRELFLFFDNPGAGYLVQGNPDLEPEKSRGLNVSAQLSLDRTPFRNVTVRLDGYRNDVDDLIVFVPGPPSQPQIFINDNVESAVTQGIEGFVRVEWIDGFSTDASYTYLDARDLERDRALPGRSPHRVTFRALLDYDPWGLSAWVRGSWVDEAPFFFEEDGGARFRTEFAPAHVNLDVRLQQRIGDHISTFVGADNLLDAGDPALLPIAPRGVYAGVNGFY